MKTRDREILVECVIIFFLCVSGVGDCVLLLVSLALGVISSKLKFQ